MIKADVGPKVYGLVQLLGVVVGYPLDPKLPYVGQRPKQVRGE
jgi:hypothetical protein